MKPHAGYTDIDMMMFTEGRPSWLHASMAVYRDHKTAHAKLPRRRTVTKPKKFPLGGSGFSTEDRSHPLT